VVAVERKLPKVASARKLPKAVSKPLDGSASSIFALYKTLKEAKQLPSHLSGEVLPARLSSLKIGSNSTLGRNKITRDTVLNHMILHDLYRIETDNDYHCHLDQSIPLKELRRGFIHSILTFKMTHEEFEKLPDNYCAKEIRKGWYCFKETPSRKFSRVLFNKIESNPQKRLNYVTPFLGSPYSIIRSQSFALANLARDRFKIQMIT